ncbi:FapA family protein [Halobacillus yeomjeoni]|uniref:DUF342 domain-containing protein n=1 Tax=Halobacillus yeomjeoni TaxID=311194 RepID=UPI001CD3E4E9|nr:FapA family protein [Halobacillus yeomjeoni]MCA0983303.1 FapA family protein [Halobacillus yeomjeoni]
MENPKKFLVSISHDKMEGKINKTSHFDNNVTTEEVMDALKEKGIVFGILNEKVEQLVNSPDTFTFPSVIASGEKAVSGVDGSVEFEKEYHPKIDNHDKVNFRDVLSIPSVVENEKIARLHPPTDGKPGKNVLGQVIEPLKGKMPKVRAGKNTIYNETDRCFYAQVDGRLHTDERFIRVQPVFQVHGDLDMKVGNVDFIGSVVINGDVPTGYRVKAKGDITVNGTVEGAHLDANGSIFITEGISGLGRANVNAALDVRTGYINQAHVTAGQDLFVENSITHSHCHAEERVFCQRGNIIGGSIRAGFNIEAKEIGNSMNVATSIHIENVFIAEEKKSALIKDLETKNNEMKKLVTIRDKIKEIKKVQGKLQGDQQLTFVRIVSSIEKLNKDITSIQEELKSVNATKGDNQNCFIKANHRLFGNVQLSFGKESRRIHREYKYALAVLEEGRIVIKPNHT